MNILEEKLIFLWIKIEIIISSGHQQESIVPQIVPINLLITMPAHHLANTLTTIVIIMNLMRFQLKVIRTAHFIPMYSLLTSPFKFPQLKAQMEIIIQILKQGLVIIARRGIKILTRLTMKPIVQLRYSIILMIRNLYQYIKN